MVPPVTDITGEVIVYKHRISGIGEVHFKIKGSGSIPCSMATACDNEREQEQ
jgi:hypothetical protein